MQFSNIRGHCRARLYEYNEEVNFCPTSDKPIRHSWIGGSIVGEMSAFHNFWVSKNEWKEAGSAKGPHSGMGIINKKCQ